MRIEISFVGFNGCTKALPEARCIGERLTCGAIKSTDERGNRIVEDTLLILVNAYYKSVPFLLPTPASWQHSGIAMDTQQPRRRRESAPVLVDGSYVLAPRSLVMLRIRAGRLIHHQWLSESGTKWSATRLRFQINPAAEAPLPVV